MTGHTSPSSSIDDSRARLDAAELVARFADEDGPFSQLSVVPVSASTNTAVADALAVDDGGWPHMSALVADHQSAGRGRAGRGWETPQGAALTASMVLRPPIELKEYWGLVPIAVGVGAVRAVRAAGVAAELKWPNDVVAPATEGIVGWGRWRKIAGVLCEVVGDAIVAGVGINVTQSTEELPVSHATSLQLEGGTIDRAVLLGDLGREVAHVLGQWAHARATFRETAQDICVTIGQRVTVDMPGSDRLVGVATSLSAVGGLVVVTDMGDEHEVLVGDVRVRGAE